MYVKELTIRGFKSFANATTLRFQPGVTAIVGPNGSGKSNVVDALSWVMGEQGAKSLRGSSMEDVIFAGTSTRAPLGRAQVSLTIDNTDKTLDIDYSEVTISRTIFRNGGSEYAINGSPVRLLDVQELLSDTGLGAHMHVVVGQGRLDSILKATPADNRAFIEEAAGILKHRKRKERALRKLQSTQENVNRLDDLLTEIQRQLGPLRRQARVSRRADSIQVIIRDATSRLLADEAQSLMQQRDNVRHELATTREKLLTAQRKLTSTKLNIERLEADSSKTGPAINAINQTYHSLAGLQERLRSLAALAGEREKSWRSQISSIGGDDPQLLTARADELSSQLQSAKKQADEARLSFDNKTQHRAGIEQGLAALRQIITQLRASAQEQEAHKAKLRETIARQEAHIQGMSQRVEDLGHQKNEYTASAQQARARLDELQQDADNQQDNLEDIKAQAQDALELARSEHEKIDSQIRDVDNAIISLKAKADALNDTLEARSSSGDVERSSVTTAGNLADYISLREGWEEAIAKALGPFANAVIIPDASERSVLLRVAREEKMGRAVVMNPLAVSEYASKTASRVEGAAGANGVAGDEASAAHAVGINPSLRGTEREDIAQGVVRSVQMLLNDVGLAHDVDEAEKLVESGRFVTVMTEHGETFSAVGAVGGTSRTPSDLSLTARRDKALAQVESDALKKQQLCADKIQIDERFDAARAHLQVVNTQITENRVRMQQRENDITAARNSVESLTRRIAQIDNQIADISAEKQSHTATLFDLRKQLEAVEHADDAHVDMESTVQREHELDSSLNTARNDEVTARVEWNNATSHAQSLERQITLLRSQAQQAAQRREKIEQRNAQLELKAQAAASIQGKAQAAAEELNAHVQRAVKKREQIQQQASEHDKELSALRKLRNEQEPVVAKLTQMEHDADVVRERIATQWGQLTQRIVDEVGSTVDSLIENYGPQVSVPVFDDAGQLILLNPDNEDEGFKTQQYDREREQKKLDKARRDLVALGKVNPLATEEFDALEARHSYLSKQRHDVVTSRDDLLGLIKELDTTMIEVFRSAYEDTAAAFQTVFAQLFPGGKGRLRLDNPDDILTTGVVVEASPAGKRVKQLSLLSGGERSLTALALLFAIFTARPSPFYIMDEVEAALDDVNLTRLLNVINTLREHAQIIVITHQQRTMSIADVLYGVTMRSDGVTAVISQKLTQGSAVND